MTSRIAWSVLGEISRRCILALQLARYKALWQPFKDIHKGETVFIIGNGPSLCPADLELIARRPSFGSNKIYLLFGRTTWRPTYYSVEDELVAKQNINAINNAEMIRLAFYRRDFNRTLEPKHPHMWFDDWHYYRPFPKFSMDPARGLFWGGSVLYINAQIAVWMGATTLAFIGVDFQFHETQRNSQGYLVGQGEVNHFASDYRRPGELWNAPNLHRQVKSFECLRDATRNLGISAINVTRGGALNVLERRPLEALL